MMREAAGVLETPAQPGSSTCASPARTSPATRRWSAAAPPRCSSPTCRPGDPALREVARGGQGGESRPAPRLDVHAAAARGGRRGRDLPPRGRRQRRRGAAVRAEGRCARPSARSPCTAPPRCPTGATWSSSRSRCRPTAVICGGGHVARAVAPAALAADFAVTVLDDREEFADPRRFPGRQGRPGSVRRRAGAARRRRSLLRRHRHPRARRTTWTSSMQALRTPARYIGLMASRSKHARMVDGAAGGRARRRRHRPRALAHRSGHRRGDPGGARGEHRRRDDPGARRQGRLTPWTGCRRSSWPPATRRAWASAQAAPRPRRPHPARARRGRVRVDRRRRRRSS